MMARGALLAFALSGVAAQTKPAGIPAGCSTYNDGCNTCSVVNGALGGSSFFSRFFSLFRVLCVCFA
jgi:hypothetical protein